MDRRKIVVTAEELGTLRERLADLAGRLSILSKCPGPHIRGIDLRVEETRPLRPVYPEGGGMHIGYVQAGPCKLVITIEDYEHDGHIRADGESW